MKRFSLLLALIMITCLLSPAAMAATSGSCGTNITWRYTSSNKTLTFTCSGEGQMNDYSYDGAPWYQYRNNIDHVVMTGSVTYIGKYNFCGIGGADFTLPDTVTTIGASAFYQCTIRSIDLPALLTRIKTSAFEMATFEHELVIPDRVEAIESRAFYGSGVPSLTLPTSLRTISMNAFSLVYGPPSLELPEGLTSLGTNAFSNCNSLTEVTIPASLSRFGDRVFVSCTRLEAIHVATGNTILTDVDGVLFNKEATKLLQYPAAKQDEHYDVPPSVTELDAYSFSHSKSLKSVSLPETVASIGQNAFGMCADDLTLCVVAGSPAHDYAIEHGLAVAFASPFGHADLVLPDDLTAIRDEAFMGTDAAVVYIPAGVTSIGSRAFADCPDLRHINLPEGASLAGDAFDGCGMVYLYGMSGGSAETYAADHDNVTFVPLEVQ